MASSSNAEASPGGLAIIPSYVIPLTASVSGLGIEIRQQAILPVLGCSPADGGAKQFLSR